MICSLFKNHGNKYLKVGLLLYYINNIIIKSFLDTNLARSGFAEKMNCNCIFCNYVKLSKPMQTFGRLGRYGQINRKITNYAKECSNSCVAKATGQQKAIDPVQEEFTRD